MSMQERAEQAYNVYLAEMQETISQKGLRLYVQTWEKLEPYAQKAWEKAIETAVSQVLLELQTSVEASE